jgi:hypothetical protein
MSDDLPEMTIRGMSQLAKIKRDSRPGFLGFWRGEKADFEDMREEMFGHRNRFAKVEYRLPSGLLEKLYHCMECRHGIRNKSPGMHHRDCSFYREEELSKWVREGAEA